ncbi:MAG: UMP kinase [Oscillospiraceae bacterium]
MGLKYKRILLKLSGEALAGERGVGLDFDVITPICESIKKCVELGAEVAIVVGGGNFWRGRSSGQMDRTKADHMGMLATVINAIAVCDTLEHLGVEARVQSAIAMPEVAELFIKDKAVRHLKKGRVVVFGGGIGSPYFSTDTTSSLRAIEIGADVVFKATMVDGVYDKDPHKFDDAVRYDELTFKDVLEKELGVMDSTSAAMCRDNGMPVLVFSLEDPDNIVRAITGENIGTLVVG